jgi:hypothetical protein
MLSLIVFLSSAISVFATDETGPISSGDAEDPARAAITKILKMPIGTTTPEATFAFQFEKMSLDGDITQSAKNAMPAINIAAVVSSQDTGTTPEGSGIKTVIKETGSIFEIKNMDKNWPRAGIYIYNVTEDKTSYPALPGEDMSYSDAKYEFTVYVDNSPSGLYVAAIAAKIIVKDPSNYDSETRSKVDPTPGGDPEEEDDYSKVIFTNKFLKNLGGPDPSDENDVVLTVSKEVSGLAADQSKYFHFGVTVLDPETINAENRKYKAYVLNEKGEVVTNSNNAMNMYTDNDEYGKFIIFDAGQVREIHLTHGQKLAFMDLPVGSGFIVEEMAVPKFTPEYILTLNGKKDDAVVGSENSSLSTGKHFITEGSDAAGFTNMFRKVTPMGISVDILPYILMIAMALFIFILSITIRYRRRANCMQ